MKESSTTRAIEVIWLANREYTPKNKKEMPKIGAPTSL